ncbi:MAG: 50S ribosomal protein L35 [Planctomycetota bacterium]|nr:50S ribosomal protein L35 [Planctomycetota bacterium]MDA1112969.1 50S ribosomal protein L35 [Planctomycetota bacterium]
MPKQKTKKAVSKRFKLTKNGKVIRRHQMTGHFMCAKSPKRRRNLRRSAVVPSGIAKNLVKLMGKR